MQKLLFLVLMLALAAGITGADLWTPAPADGLRLPLPQAEEARMPDEADARAESRKAPPRRPGSAQAAPRHLPTAPPENVRALWVVRDALTSPKRIHTMIADAERAGVTDLLVQVRGRGDAYYQSDLEPPAPQLVRAWRQHGKYDPLALVLQEAHARGMRVHAWMNVYLVWGGGTPPAGHVSELQPEWIAQTPDGRAMSEFSLKALTRRQTEGTYLEPGHPGVVKHFVSVVEEVLQRYAVDGIHLDYVRYPEMELASPVMRNSFQRMTGVDPAELADADRAARVHGAQRTAELLREWKEFRAAQVNALVRGVRRATLAARPGVLLSAAVKPDPDAARDRNGQDWTRWVNEGWVDVVAPMMYSTSGAKVTAQARTLAQRVPPERVWAGIAVYNQSLSAAENKIRRVRDEGLTGISIFSYNSLVGGGEDLMRLNQVR